MNRTRGTQPIICCRQILVSALMTAGVLLGVACPASAQEQPETSDLDLVALLETQLDASKRPESMGEVPTSVIVFTRKEIAALGVTTLEELMGHIPGLFVIDNYEDLLLGIRGTTGGGIQFLVNGVPHHPSRVVTTSMPERARLNIPIESVDRIEISKGPMSTTYGTNAFQGVVNIITNDPEYSPVSGSASAGNNQTYRGFARAAHQWGEHLGVVANLGYYSSRGIGGDIPTAMSDAQRATIHPLAIRKLDGLLGHDDTSVDISAKLHDLTANFRFSRMDYGIYALTPPFHQGNQIQLDTLHGSLHYRKSLLPSLQLRADAIFSSEDYSLPEVDLIAPDIEGFQEQQTRRAEVEVVLGYSPLPELNILAGYTHRTLFGIQNSAVVGDYEVNQRATPYGFNDIFAEAIVQPISQVRIGVGGRLNMNTPRSLEIDNTDVKSHTESQSTTHLVPRLSLVVTPFTGHFFKVLYGEAIQEPRVVAAASARTRERISSREINYLVIQPAWRIQASAYHQKLVDVPTRVLRYDDETMMQQSLVETKGRLRVMGLELEAEIEPTIGLRVACSTSINDVADQVHPTIAPGNSPRMLTKARASYDFGALVLSGFLSYVGAIQTDWRFADGNDGVQRLGDRAPAYVLVGMNARYDHIRSGTYANLHLANALDSDVRYPANELVDFQHGSYGPARQLVLTLGARL